MISATSMYKAFLTQKSEVSKSSVVESCCWMISTFVSSKAVLRKPFRASNLILAALALILLIFGTFEVARLGRSAFPLGCFALQRLSFGMWILALLLVTFLASTFLALVRAFLTFLLYRLMVVVS